MKNCIKCNSDQIVKKKTYGTLTEYQCNNCFFLVKENIDWHYYVVYNLIMTPESYQIYIEYKNDKYIYHINEIHFYGKIKLDVPRYDNLYNSKTLDYLDNIKINKLIETYKVFK